MSGTDQTLTGSLAERPIQDVVRRLRSTRATGTLEVTLGEQRRRLHFHDGDLYLAASHPLSKRLEELLAELGGDAPGEPRRQLLELVQRMAGVIGEWKKGSYRFEADADSLPAERVGPLPTERLVMLAASSGLDEAALLHQLGGAAGQLTARSTAPPPDALGLEPEEQFLLERLAQPMKVERVLAESPVPRLEILGAMVRLKSAGRLRALGRDGSGARVPVAVKAPEDDFADRLFTRFERSLREEPLNLPVEEYRRRVTDLVGRVGGLNAYEMLGVDPATSSDDVQARYEELARLVHPANEVAFGLTGLRPMLEMLFDRATQAYFSLADPERRRQYNEAQSIDLGGVGVSGPQRDVEQRDLARQHYDQALVLAAKGEFHFAVELLELAVKTDRRVEYLLALARVQSKNPKWSARAIASCRAALEIDAQNADVRYQLGELYEAAGDAPRARAQYQAAARENPNHAQAAAKVRSLEAAGGGDRGSGLFDRLFGRRG